MRDRRGFRVRGALPGQAARRVLLVRRAAVRLRAVGRRRAGFRRAVVRRFVARVRAGVVLRVPVLSDFSTRAHASREVMKELRTILWSRASFG